MMLLFLRHTSDLWDGTSQILIYMIFIQSINEIQTEVNSLDNDLAVLLLVIQGLGRVQAPWIDHRGNIT